MNITDYKTFRSMNCLPVSLRMPPPSPLVTDGSYCIMNVSFMCSLSVVEALCSPCGPLWGLQPLFGSPCSWIICGTCVKIYLQDINGDNWVLCKRATRCSGMNAVWRAFDSSSKKGSSAAVQRFVLKY